MPNPKDIYKKIWETAYERGEIFLTFPDRKSAQRMRLNLYVGIRAYRLDSSLDPIFSRKLDQLELSEDIKNLQVIIRLRSRNPLAQEAARQLGFLENE